MFLRVANGQKSNCASTCFPPIAPLVLQNKEVTQLTKLEKIGADLKRARIKQAEWNQRVKDLENRYREEENSVIHSMVHAANLTPEQLAQIIELAAKGAVGVYPEQVDVPEINHEEDRENDD